MRGELESVALPGGAAGIKRQQFGGRVVRLLRGLALSLLPLRRTERVQRRGFWVGAGIARNNVQLRDGDVEFGFVGVMQFEKFRFALAKVEVNQAVVAGDPVLFMHHRIADFQLGQIAQPVIERGFFAATPLGAPRRAVGVQLGLGDDGERFVFVCGR